MSSDLNAPLLAAVDALPKDSLLRWDSDPNATEELLSGWMSGGLVGEVHQRYVSAYSIFKAAVDAGARGHIPNVAGRIAADELEMLKMSAIKAGNTDFALLTGNAQLEQFGKVLGDYQVLSAAAAMVILAQLHSPQGDELDRQLGRALMGMKRQELRTHIDRARKQKAHDTAALRALDRYERIADAAE